jgi:hypothetical protein
MLYPRLLQRAEEGAQYLSTAPGPGQGFAGYLLHNARAVASRRVCLKLRH